MDQALKPWMGAMTAVCALVTLGCLITGQRLVGSMTAVATALGLIWFKLVWRAEDRGR